MARTETGPAQIARRRRVRLAALLCLGALTVQPVRAAEDTWVPQKTGTADFVFSVRYDPEVPQSRASGTPLEIKVVALRSGKTVQLIPLHGAYPVDLRPDDRIAVVDANFDGRPDIDFYAMSGGAGPNDTHVFYLFDPVHGRFHLDAMLSSLSQVAIGPDHDITSEFRDGCCEHHSQTYRYIGGRLTLVASWQEAVQGNDVVTTTGRLVHGKMRYSVKRQPISSAGSHQEDR